MKIFLPLIALFIFTTNYSIAARKPVSKKPKQSLSSAKASKPELLIESRTSNQNIIINIRQPKDVVSFLGNTLPDCGFKGYNGLTDERRLQSLVDEQNYIEVLKHLWTETNQMKRINWLTKQSEAGHVICMFELSKEMAQVNNVSESLLWYKTGILRIVQDYLCCNDSSVGAAIDCLKMYYSPYVFIASLLKYLDTGISTSDITKIEKECFSSALTKLRALKTYPSPRWITYHGLYAFSPEMHPDALKPSSEWAELRKKYIEECEESKNTMMGSDWDQLLEKTRKKNESQLDKLRISMKNFLKTKNSWLRSSYWFEIQQCLPDCASNSSN